MNGHVVGYARVSSTDQDLSLQVEQLTAAGCTRMFAEKKSGTNADDRTELEACLAYVRDGDTLMVTRLDRLARSMSDFFKIMELLKAKQVAFRCLLQPEIDTTTINGRLVTGIMAAFAEFETSIRKERQREGIDRAKAAGVYKGRSHAVRKKSRKAARQQSHPTSVGEPIAEETTPEMTPRKGPFGRWIFPVKPDSV